MRGLRSASRTSAIVRVAAAAAACAFGAILDNVLVWFPPIGLFDRSLAGDGVTDLVSGQSLSGARNEAPASESLPWRCALSSVRV